MLDKLVKEKRNKAFCMWDIFWPFIQNLFSNIYYLIMWSTAILTLF